MKHPQKFLNQYKEHEMVVLKISAVGTAAAQTAIPEGTQRIEISYAGAVLTADGTAHAVAAADDALLTVSVDGVNWFVPTNAGVATPSTTANTLQCDLGGVLTLNYSVKHVRLTTAANGGTETISFNVVCISE